MATSFSLISFNLGIVDSVDVPLAAALSVDVASAINREVSVTMSVLVAFPVTARAGAPTESGVAFLDIDTGAVAALSTAVLTRFLRASMVRSAMTAKAIKAGTAQRLADGAVS